MKLKKITEQISLNPQSKTLFQLLVNATGIPMSTSFKIGKVHKKMIEEVDDFIKTRNAKITELGEEIYFKTVSYDDKGKEVKDIKKNKEKIVRTEQVEITNEEEKKGLKPIFRVKKENMEKFYEEEKELLDKDINIDIPVIKAENIGEPIIEIENLNNKGEMITIKITPLQIATLDWLLS